MSDHLLQFDTSISLSANADTDQTSIGSRTQAMRGGRRIQRARQPARGRQRSRWLRASGQVPRAAPDCERSSDGVARRGLALRFNHAWRDGTSHVLFTPRELDMTFDYRTPELRCGDANRTLKMPTRRRGPAESRSGSQFVSDDGLLLAVARHLGRHRGQCGVRVVVG